MTHKEQDAWLKEERQRCERLLAETMIIGGTVLNKARTDLAAVIGIQARLATLENPPLFSQAQEEGTS